MSMFEFSQFTVNASNFNVYDISKSDMQKTSPGYIQGMTSCPIPTDTFTGREEVLTKLEGFFHHEHATERTKTFLLYGLGGSGKTQIALEFTKRFKQRFTAIFFITADQEDSIQGSYLDIAKTRISGVQNAQHWKAGLHWLSMHDEDWLIVIDNANDPKIPLMKYLPSCGHGNVIITSTNPELGVIADQSLELSGMPPEEGIQLLVKHAFKELNKISDQQQKVAAKIAKELHYFPFALVQAGAYINKQQCLFEYLDRLENQREQLLSKGSRQLKDKYSRSMYETWNLSWGQLSPDSRMFLGLCAHLHYENIPRALFERGVENWNMAESPLGPSHAVTEGKSILQRIATPEMDFDEMALDKIMDDAASYSLILINDQSHEYMFHPLVHKWLKDKVKDSYREAIEGIVVLAVGEISQEMEIVSLNQKDHEFFQRLSPHVRALGDSFISDHVVKFAIGYIWLELYQCQEATIMWEPLLDVMIKKLGLGHTLTLYHEYQMARVYKLSGRGDKALELQQKLFETSKEVLGDEHKATLSRIHNLAITLAIQRRTDEALGLQQSLVETSKRVLGEEDLYTLDRTQNLAETLLTLGRTNEALELEQSLLRASKRVLDKEHPDTYTLKIIQNVVGTLQELGKKNEALELEQSLLKISKRALGEEDPQTLYRTQKMTETLRALGRTDEALKLEQSLLEISKRVLGEEDPEILYRTQKLAEALRALGRTDEALELEQSLLEISKRVLGEEDPKTLYRTQDMAEKLRASGRTNEALELEQSLLETSKRVLGEENPETLYRIQDMAEKLRALGRRDEAFELEQSLLETSKRLLGEEHPQTLHGTQKLTETLRALGRPNEALKHEQSLLEISKRVLEKEHPDTYTLDIIQNLPVTLRALGRTIEAFELEQSLLKTSKRVLGEEHPDTMDRTQKLAETLRVLGRPNEALELAQSLLETLKRVLGKEHPDTFNRTQDLANTFNITQDLAETLRDLEKTNEALELEQDLLETSKRVLGEEDPETLYRTQDMADKLKALGRTDEAFELEKSLL